MATKVRVWDLPTRLFHWALALCVIGSFATAWLPGSWIEWHARLGYAVLALVTFRLLWGVVGGRWSRFTAFLYAPSSVLAYLRGRAHPDHLVGHNPLGAGSVFALLLALLIQVGTGLVSDDEIAFTGPLNRFVSSAQGLSATWYHKAIGEWVLVALVVLHLAAILYYLLAKRENLVRPMLSGDKQLERPVPSSRDDLATRLLALVLASGCAAGVWWLVTRMAAGGSFG
jgi:cytochrome b